MSSTSSVVASDALDQLFSECAALERVLIAIKQSIEKLDPAVKSGRVTTEHLMTLAFRLETAERGMIDIAHRIDDTAVSVAHRHDSESHLH
jgi:hypothetical protein